MKNKLIELNIWYDNLAHTRRTLHFLIFFLMVVIAFSLPLLFQIPALIIILSLKLYANYAQRNRLLEKNEEKNYAVQQ
jgi:hypothetical protein